MVLVPEEYIFAGLKLIQSFGFFVVLSLLFCSFVLRPLLNLRVVSVCSLKKRRMRGNFHPCVPVHEHYVLRAEDSVSVCFAPLK